MKTFFHKMIFRLANTQALRENEKELESQLAVYQLGWPPGHFYSPLSITLTIGIIVIGRLRYLLKTGSSGLPFWVRR